MDILVKIALWVNGSVCTPIWLVIGLYLFIGISMAVWIANIRSVTWSLLVYMFLWFPSMVIGMGVLLVTGIINKIRELLLDYNG